MTRYDPCPPEAAAPTAGLRRRSVAIVGSGPRGLSVLERLSAGLIADQPGGAECADLPGRQLIDIFLIDSVQVGCGRVWRTDQPEWLLMNTVAGEITAYSGRPDEGPARPSAGPSFAQWWTAKSGIDRANDYAPRAVYGRYLMSTLDSIATALPSHVTLHRLTSRLEDLEQGAEGYHLRFADGRTLTVDRAVLTTGHSKPALTGPLRELATFAASRPKLLYIAGDSAADMPLSDIPAASKVGILGMGLTSYDVLACLTLGRGGAFLEMPNGIRYLPSGDEPTLFAGSRSGMPQPARGRNQKASVQTYQPLYFTPHWVRFGARERELDFRNDVLPRLMAEVNLVFYAATLRERGGKQVADSFTERARAVGGQSVSALDEVAAEFGLADVPGIDFDSLSLPFRDRTFDSRQSFHETLLAAIGADLREAERGNIDSPVKAALDMLRSFRWIIRELVDFGGLSPRSHKLDLLDWYAPRSSFLAAGPPLVRLRHVAALIEAGVLMMAGPQASFTADLGQDRFVVSSPVISDSAVAVETVIDARIPAPDLGHDLSPLARRLRERGIWSAFVNRGASGEFVTGGVAVTTSPFHPVGADGHPDTGLYVLGIPSEHTRWFTQVVATGPSSWSDFMQDADAVADDILRILRPDTRQPSAQLSGAR